MKSYKYFIIGGGMTADSAVKGILEVDPESSIGLVSSETNPPYNRPPLTKGLWKGKPFESVWRKTADKSAELHLGRKIVSLDADNLVAKDDHGDEYQAEKILLATGGTPRRLPFGEEDILYYRTLEDYKRLARMAEEKQEFAVIGSGFIGAEIAAALAMNGKKVTMLFPEESIGERMYPHDLSHYLNDYYREKGVELLAREELAGVSSNHSRHVLKTKSGRELAADGIVAGLGIQPNTELAKMAGLEMNNGIIVNEYLQTSKPNIYAAGDVAEFYNPSLDKRIRVEHEDNANSSGKLAGRNMAGDSATYDYLPYFYSDLFELGYEAIGELDSRLMTVADWAEPFQKGVIYYLKDDRVRGVLLWNVWDKVPAARELIAQPGPIKVEDLKAKEKSSWKIAY
jgi:NADPH-dependent 2,4-dienoyl-CoA reductase/sulfur reductase-like enzyme